MLSERAVGPESASASAPVGAVVAAQAPSRALSAAVPASSAPVALVTPATVAPSPAANSAAAQLSLPNQASVLANATITTSLEPNSTAVATAAPLSIPTVTAVAQNLSAEPLVLTQEGMMYDLKGIASAGACQTLWQLIQLSPNLTIWADAIQVLRQLPSS